MNQNINLPNLVICPNGHYYEPTANSVCPFCGVSGRIQEDFYGNGFPPVEPESIEHTLAEDSDDPFYGQERSEGKNIKDSYNWITDKELQERQKEIQEASGRQPVGWLVCIQGPSKGCDYRLYAGNNSIGRASHMDICLNKDPYVSRERNAVVIYDPILRTFHISPGEGINVVLYNGKPLRSPVELKAYDIIQPGNSKLLLIPLCGKKFSWE